MSDKNSGWSEYGQLVLKELERLNSNYESLNDKIDSIKSDVHEEISALKNDITKVKAMQYTLDELKAFRQKYEDAAVLKTLEEINKWKGEIDEVISPSQLKEYIINTNKSLSDLKTFKTKAVTIFLVVQALMGIAIGVLKFFF